MSFPQQSTCFDNVKHVCRSKRFHKFFQITTGNIFVHDAGLGDDFDTVYSIRGVIQSLLVLDELMHSYYFRSSALLGGCGSLSLSSVSNCFGYAWSKSS